jgi:hypothetical protein
MEANMEMTTLLHPAHRSAPRSMQLVLVRANGPLFYSIAAAALLESLAPVYTARLRHLFRTDHAFCDWMENEWLPRKAARAAALRDYVEKTWPELDWTSTFEQCRGAVESDGGLGPHKATAAHEALAHCVAATESGVFYRSVARWADDPRLREMAASMAHEEALSFPHFRAAYERRARFQRFGLFAAWRAMQANMRTARDLHLATAFRTIRGQCGPNVPFPVMDYAEFLRRMRAVIERHGGLGTVERILLRTWKSRPCVPNIPESQPRAAACFRPVFKAAA